MVTLRTDGEPVTQQLARQVQTTMLKIKGTGDVYTPPLEQLSDLLTIKSDVKENYGMGVTPAMSVCGLPGSFSETILYKMLRGQADRRKAEGS